MRCHHIAGAGGGRNAGPETTTAGLTPGCVCSARPHPWVHWSKAIIAHRFAEVEPSASTSAAGRSPPARAVRTFAPADLLQPYRAACSRWDLADRQHHVAQIAVSTGVASAWELAQARDRMDGAMAQVDQAKGELAEVLFTTLRVIAGDEHLRYALLLALLDILRPGLEPLADRTAALERRVGNLEVVVAPVEGD